MKPLLIRWAVAAMALGLSLSACGNDQAAPAVDKPTTEEAAKKETLAAMTAAFPEADKATGIVQHPATAKSVMPEATRAVFLKQVGAQYYLLAAREMKDGCHSCQASLSVFYLTRTGEAFKVDAAYPDLVQSGGWGAAGEVKPVTIAGRPGFSDVSGFTGQGCTTGAISVYLFDSGGPTPALNNTPLFMAYEEKDLNGEVVDPPPAGADFAIHYSGKTGETGKPPIDATVAYRLKGSELLPTSGAVPKVVADGC